MIISGVNTEIITIGATVIADFDLLSTNGSNEVVFPACCVDCKTPSITTDLYDGQIFIPVACDMPDGTKIVELITGGSGIIYDGSVVIELNKKLKTGDSVKIQVDHPTCRAISCNVIVKGKESECEDCENKEPCYIRVTELVTTIVNGKAVITTLSTESSGVLVYRLNGGDWVESFDLLPPLTLGEGHTIGFKDRNNVVCRLEYPVLIINKIITVKVYV